MKKVFFILFTCAFSLSYAQQGGANDWYFRGAYNFGFIMQHRNNMGNLVNGFVNGAEINYIKPTTGNKLWHHENNFPESGIGFSYFDLNNPKELGNLYALYAFYDIPLNDKAKPFRLYMRLGEGVAYTPVYFDPLTNHKNNVISTPFSAYVNFKWYYRWDISNRWRLEGGLNFSHASNGRATVPNLGLNLMTFNSAVVYKFLNEPKTKEIKIDSIGKVASKNELLFWACFGVNQVTVLGTKHFIQDYSLAYYRNVRNTHKFGGGVDVSYNPANIEQMQLSGDTLSNTVQNTQVGIKFSYCYSIGPWSLPVEMGYYVYSAFKGDGLFFHRIGTRYHFKNNVVAIFSLKTNFAVANYFEFGLGYRLPIRK